MRTDFPVSKQDIAEMTGTTLHTASRVLTAWETAGPIEGGRQKLLLEDPHKLLLIADGGCRGCSRTVVCNRHLRRLIDELEGCAVTGGIGFGEQMKLADGAPDAIHSVGVKTPIFEGHRFMMASTVRSQSPLVAIA